MPQIRFEGEDTKLLTDIRLIFRNPETGFIPDNKMAIRKALKLVRDQFYEETGAEVRQKPEVGDL